MSTHIPWFRYGLRETKKWLQRLRQSSDPCQGEAKEALDRCVRKDKQRDKENASIEEDFDE